MKTLIYGGRIVNEGRTFAGSIVIEADRIEHIYEGETTPRGIYQRQIDATGCFVMPGVIDVHVHFREPGLTGKGDIASESRAAAYGGVTSFFEMPNTSPQTTTLEALQEKWELGAKNSSVNYSFFFGATNKNAPLFSELDVERVPGIKLFMGASTGNMLVDRLELLENIFQTSPLPVMTHCEDTALINKRMAEAKLLYGEDPDIIHHADIRSEEACYQSTALAVSLAKKYGTKLHVAHLTTARELALFGQDSHITAEAVIAHLTFTDEDYQTLSTRIKCNPSVKTANDRAELRRALTDGRVFLVATDHAPHRLEDKEGGCAKAASGMPMIQFSLPSMLNMVDEGILPLERVVELMCHHPAQLFEVRHRGFLREGYKADIAIVRPNSRWSLTQENIQSKCGWSPLEGCTFHWEVVSTLCNGHLLWHDGIFDSAYRGEQILFRETL